MSAYETLATAIGAVLPAGWEFLEYEAPFETAPDATRVTLKIATVSRLPAAPIGSYQIDWVLTITTEYPDREIAEPALYDNLIDFLLALDGIGPWLGWTEANKALNEAGRLSYDINLRTNSKKDEA
jgi:hypothetical protein